MEVEHRALEHERATGVGLDDLALGSPLVLAVAVVTIKGCADSRTFETIMPFTSVTLLGPLAHAGNVRDSGIDRLGSSSNVARYFESFGHGFESTTATLLKTNLGAETLGCEGRWKAECVDLRYAREVDDIHTIEPWADRYQGPVKVVLAAVSLLFAISQVGVLVLPLLVPAHLWAARRSGPVGRAAWSLFPMIAVGLIVWAAVYISVGESKPTIWLLPVSAMVISACVLPRFTQPKQAVTVQ